MARELAGSLMLAMTNASRLSRVLAAGTVGPRGGRKMQLTSAALTQTPRNIQKGRKVVGTAAIGSIVAAMLEWIRVDVLFKQLVVLRMR